MSANVIILVILVMVLVLIILHDQHKQIIDLLEENGRLAKELLNKINTEIRVKEIIIKSKVQKENYFVTLEKIDKELFKQ